jgi:hypothetical protein
MCFNSAKLKSEDEQMDNNKKLSGDPLSQEEKAQMFEDDAAAHQKNIRSPSLPRRKPNYWRIMLRHTKNTGSPSLLRRIPNYWRIML